MSSRTWIEPCNSASDSSSYLADAADLALVAVVDVFGRVIVEELARLAKVPAEDRVALLVDALLRHGLSRNQEARKLELA